MRTESDKLAMAPLKVRFGAKDYDIPLLRLRDEQKWRDKLIEQLGGVLLNFNMQVDSVDIFRKGLVNGLVAFPEKLTDLLFDYAPSLPKDEILDNATREQVMAAFSEVMQVTFPFGGYLQMFTEMMKSEAIESVSQASSRLV